MPFRAAALPVLSLARRGLIKSAPGALPRNDDGCDKIPATLQHNHVEMKLKIRTCPTPPEYDSVITKHWYGLMVRFDALTL